MKIALVYPHWRTGVPPSNLCHSLDILAVHFAQDIAKKCDIVIYIRGSLFGPRTQIYEGVRYRPVIQTFDRLLSRPLGVMLQLAKRLGVRRVRHTLLHCSPLSYVGYAFQVAIDIRKRKCDIVHIFINHNFVPVIHALNPHAKIILHMHDHSQADNDHRLVQKHLRNVDSVVGVSDFITQNVQNRFPTIRNRCTTIHNGIDFDAFDDTRQKRRSGRNSVTRLLFVGRISPEKGVHVLVQAFREIAAAHPYAQLQLIGPLNVAPIDFVDPFGQDPLFEDLRPFFTNPRSYLPYMQKGLGSDLDDRVTFQGEMPHAAILRFYLDADVFVFPSLWHEPFGLPVIEAMAARLPVIATRGGAFPEIIQDGVTGYLIERGDPEGLRDAIDALLCSDEKRRAMGEAGRKRVEEVFSWNRFVRRWLDHYRAVASVQGATTTG